LIYAINKADKKREEIRTVVVDFFKNNLGFTNDEIIFIDRNEFIGMHGEESTKFSA
jgi:hypothetical protein